MGASFERSEESARPQLEILQSPKLLSMTPVDKTPHRKIVQQSVKFLLKILSFFIPHLVN
jgi:hypothetical protein